MVQEPM